jgi:hypothetical protein
MRIYIYIVHVRYMPIHSTYTHIHIYILPILSYYIYLYIYVYVYPLRALWPPEACSRGEVCLRRYFPLWTHPKVIFSFICSDYSVNFLRLRLVAFLQIYDHRLHVPQNYLVHCPLTHFWRPWASKCLTFASRCLPFGSFVAPSGSLLAPFSSIPLTFAPFSTRLWEIS